MSANGNLRIAGGALQARGTGLSSGLALVAAGHAEKGVNSFLKNIFSQELSSGVGRCAWLRKNAEVVLGHEADLKNDAL